MIAMVDPDPTIVDPNAGPGAVLRTARLVLRPLMLADASWISSGTSNPNVALMTGSIGLPNPPLTAELFIISMRAAEQNRGDRVRAIVRRADDRPMGVIGLHPRKDGAWEFGYWLAENYWGAGYATEAGRAMLDAADADGLGPVAAGHYAENAASGRVLEKLGFAYTGEVINAWSMARMASGPCPRMAYSSARSTFSG